MRSASVVGRRPGWAVGTVAQLRGGLAPAVVEQTLISFRAWWRSGLESEGSAEED